MDLNWVFQTLGICLYQSGQKIRNSCLSLKPKSQQLVLEENANVVIATTGTETPVEPPKPVDPDKIETSAKEIRWTVPDGTKKVTLFKYDKNGKYITQYSISQYIDMKPGETFIIKVK
jgi:hypothetical protein